MTARISDALLSHLSESVAAHLGLHFPRERWPDLERKMRAASRECGQQDVDWYLNRLKAGTLTRDQIEALASHLTVSETYFFREKRSLEILEADIIPGFIRACRPGGQELSVWSAGCATGEEPYSIAILLSNMISDLKEWNIRILATDLNTRSLQRASEGVYGEWSFRSTPPWVRSRYFTPTTDGRWVIAPSIKKMVTFAYLNLIEDANPSPLSSTNAMNVILCRNVLMYFTPPAMKKVVHHFYRSLADGGWLIVSPTEASHTLFSEFSTVSFTGAMLYRKADRHPQAARTFHSGHAGGQDEEILCGLPPPTMIEYHGPAGTGMPQIDQGPSVGAVEPSEAELPPISYAEAVGLYQQGRYEDAEAIIVALLSQNPGDGQAMLLLARLSANQGRLAEALACCEKAIASDKMNARAHYLRAMILQEQGWLEGAALAVKRALYLEPEFALGHFALGNIALRLGKVKESKKHFENTLALLAKYQPDDILPESEALTAGRLSALIALQKRPGDARGVGVKGTPLAGGEQSYSGHPLL